MLHAQAKKWITRCSALVALMAVGVAMASERAAGAGLPPLNYRLDDVSLQVQRQFGHGQPTLLLSLSGKGTSSLKQGDREWPFNAAPKDLVEAINGFYSARFFDLPERLRPPNSVFLKDDGSVATQVLRMADAGGTSLCFKLPGYQKCLSYAGSGPREIEDLVQGLLNDALKRAKPTPPAK